MFPYIYPTLNEIINWNETAQKLFEENGIYGFFGLKDPSIIKHLLYIIKNSIVFGEDQFPTVITKAARIWYEIARFQAFNNGNKRTALLATVSFLMNNQLFFNFDDIENTLYTISKKIASNKYKEKDVQIFIFNNVKVNFDLMNAVFKELNE